MAEAKLRVRLAILRFIASRPEPVGRLQLVSVVMDCGLGPEWINRMATQGRPPCERRRYARPQGIFAACGVIIANQLWIMDGYRIGQGMPPLVVRHWHGKKGDARTGYTVEVTEEGRAYLARDGARIRGPRKRVDLHP